MPIVIDAGVPAHIVDDALKIIEDKTTLRFRRLDSSADVIPDTVIRVRWHYLKTRFDSHPCRVDSTDPLNIEVTSACAYQGFVLRGLAAALGLHHVHRNTTNETPYIVCNDPNTILHDASMILHPARAAYCPVKLDRDSPLNDDPACSPTHTTRVDTGGVIGNLSDADIEQLNKRYPSPGGKSPRSIGATVATIVKTNADPAIRVVHNHYRPGGGLTSISSLDPATPIPVVTLFKKGHVLSDPDLDVNNASRSPDPDFHLRNVVAIPASGPTTNLVTEFQPYLLATRPKYHAMWKLFINNPAAAWVRDHPHRVVATYGSVEEPKIRVFDLPLRIVLDNPPASPLFTFTER
ncbi:hypothetical protein [Paludibacterium paludis]|uniref:Uncharacterized protein n=1 Tax=Paludibacterium paludis TaxID=1225769 RepID=A0A918P5Y9_9NEIS|nr:hypothetical protein [Paludibacterium paludis]GGY23792.1 hypothetical protein GCM10011289_29340 [Paludibacterium paludis]